MTEEKKKKVEDKKQKIIVDSKTKQEKESATILEAQLEQAAEEKTKYQEEGYKEFLKGELEERFGGEVIDQPQPIKQSEKEWDLSDDKEYKWISQTPIDMTNKILDEELDEEVEQKLLFFDQLLSDYMFALEYPDIFKTAGSRFTIPEKGFKDMEQIFSNFRRYLVECRSVLRWRVDIDILDQFHRGKMNEGEKDLMLDANKLWSEWISEFIERYTYYRSVLNDRAYEALKKKLSSEEMKGVQKFVEGK